MRCLVKMYMIRIKHPSDIQPPEVWDIHYNGGCGITPMELHLLWGCIPFTASLVEQTGPYVLGFDQKRFVAHAIVLVELSKEVGQGGACHTVTPS